MFKFIVHRLGFLKHLPLVPHIYDALLKIQLFFTRRSLLDCLDDIEEEVCAWDNVTISLHKYGGTQFNFQTHEFGHLHGNGLLDIPVNRAIKEELMRNYAIEDHHVFKDSRWISFWIRTSSDKDCALQLLQQAYAFQESKVLTTS